MSLPVPTPEPAARTQPGADEVRRLLAAHVPLSLLMDLADPDGPPSGELFTAEPGSCDWLPGS